MYASYVKPNHYMTFSYNLPQTKLTQIYFELNVTETVNFSFVLQLKGDKITIA